jgi:hypothetical protein
MRGEGVFIESGSSCESGTDAATRFQREWVAAGREPLANRARDQGSAALRCLTSMNALAALVHAPFERSKVT